MHSIKYVSNTIHEDDSYAFSTKDDSHLEHRSIKDFVEVAILEGQTFG